MQRKTKSGERGGCGRGREVHERGRGRKKGNWKEDKGIERNGKRIEGRRKNRRRGRKGKESGERAVSGFLVSAMAADQPWQAAR